MKTLNKKRNIKPKISRSTKGKKKEKKNKGKKSRKNPRK
jgi:hypothetical protein